MEKTHEVVFQASAHKTFRLSFHGEIVDKAVNASLPVCKVFGKELFVNEPACNRLLNASSHHVMPSWIIPAVEPKQVPNVTWDKTVHKSLWSYHPPSSKKNRKLVVDVTIFYLNLEKDEKGDIKLIRNAIPEMIKVSKAEAPKERIHGNAIPLKWKPWVYLLQ